MSYKRVVGNRKEIKKLWFATSENIQYQHKKKYKCVCEWCVSSRTLDKHFLSDIEIKQILKD